MTTEFIVAFVNTTPRTRSRHVDVVPSTLLIFDEGDGVSFGGTLAVRRSRRATPGKTEM